AFELRRLVEIAKDLVRGRTRHHQVVDAERLQPQQRDRGVISGGDLVRRVRWPGIDRGEILATAHLRRADEHAQPEAVIAAQEGALAGADVILEPDGDLMLAPSAPGEIR